MSDEVRFRDRDEEMLWIRVQMRNAHVPHNVAAQRADEAVLRRRKETG